MGGAFVFVDSSCEHLVVLGSGATPIFKDNIPGPNLTRGIRDLRSAGCDRQRSHSPRANFKAFQPAGVSFLSLQARLNCGDLEVLLWSIIFGVTFGL